MSQESIKYASYLSNWNYEDAGKSLEDFKKLIMDNLRYYDDLSMKSEQFDEAVKNQETTVIQDLQFKLAGEDKETNLKIYIVLAKLLHINEIQILGRIDGLFPGANYIQEDLISNFNLGKVDLINMISGIQSINQETENMLKEKGLAEYTFELHKYVWDNNKLRSMTNEELLELYKEIKQYK